MCSFNKQMHSYCFCTASLGAFRLPANLSRIRTRTPFCQTLTYRQLAVTASSRVEMPGADVFSPSEASWHENKRIHAIKNNLMWSSADETPLSVKMADRVIQSGARFCLIGDVSVPPLVFQTKRYVLEGPDSSALKNLDTSSAHVSCPLCSLHIALGLLNILVGNLMRKM